MRDAGENRLVARFREMAAGSLGRDVLVASGDDAAVLRVSKDRLLLLTCDMMVEGVHFRREWATPQQIGWKAMAANLSDIAAMGGDPGFAVASVAAPGDVSREMAEGIAQGLIECAARYGASLVGGDLVGSPGPLVVDVALTGWASEGLVLRRSGARAGDVVLVSGPLGASAAGLAALRQGLSAEDERIATAVTAHLTPVPRLAEARAIAATRLATAMMDLSDGLATDLPRLCAESGVGALLRADQVPVHAACRATAGLLNLDPLELAITGGEDYELLLTCPPEAVGEIQQAVRVASGAPLTVIGEVAGGDEAALVDAAGRRKPLGSGFDHFAVSG